MLLVDVITSAVSINVATAVFSSLFCIAKPKWCKRLQKLGFCFGLIGALGFIIIPFINILSKHSGCYGGLSVFILSICFFPLITISISHIHELMGGFFLIIETLVLGILPFGISPAFKLTPFTGILYHTSGFILLLSGSLIIHGWRVNQAYNPVEQYQDLRNAGLFTGLVSAIILTLTYLFASYNFTANKQIEIAVLTIMVLVLMLAGVSLAWKLPYIGGWILLITGILNLFSLFTFKQYFIWEIPLLADITIVSLLPASSGVFLLISCREKSRILEDHIESSSKLWGLTRKEVVKRCKKQVKQRCGAME